MEYFPGQFRINFNGNGHTSAQRAFDFAMLRAADLTLAHGCNFFIIVHSAENISIQNIQTPGYATTTGSATGTTQGQYIGNQYSGSTTVSGSSTTVYSRAKTSSSRNRTNRS